MFSDQGVNNLLFNLDLCEGSNQDCGKPVILRDTIRNFVIKDKLLRVGVVSIEGETLIGQTCNLPDSCSQKSFVTPKICNFTIMGPS